MRYAKKRVYTWTPSIAYCVGLITSDGCLQKDGRHLDVTSIDYEQLQNFCKALGRDLAISRKSNNSSTPAFRIQFSDVAFYDFLLEAGLTPAKSLTISALKIPQEYYSDFLRGLFDGDGTTYGYVDKRWKNSNMFYVAFSAASRSFMEYVRSANSKLIGTSAGSIRKGKRAYSLVYAKADSAKIAAFMYYNDDLPALTRKRDKLQAFMAINQPVILASDARVVKLVNTQP